MIVFLCFFCLCFSVRSILKLCCSNDVSGNLLVGHYFSCCRQTKPLRRIGKMISSPAVERPSAFEYVWEMGSQVPIVHFDGVKEWTVNESLYVLGLSAWLRLRPFISFFTEDFIVKVGTSIPCLVRSPLARNYLVWHMIKGFPHEELGVCFEKTNKVW